MNDQPKPAGWMENEHGEKIPAMRLQPKPASGEWTVHQWRDGAGNLTSSYEIHEGDKLVVADLEKSECDDIAEAHNAAVATEWEKCKQADVQLDHHDKVIKTLREQLAAERSKYATEVQTLYAKIHNLSEVKQRLMVQLAAARVK